MNGWYQIGEHLWIYENDIKGNIILQSTEEEATKDEDSIEKQAGVRINNYYTSNCNRTFIRLFNLLCSTKRKKSSRQRRFEETYGNC